jgi:hypothetical protein
MARPFRIEYPGAVYDQRMNTNCQLSDRPFHWLVLNRSVTPMGSGSQASEEAILTSLHAAGFIADEVELIWQTSLENRTVKITCKTKGNGGI